MSETAEAFKNAEMALISYLKEKMESQEEFHYNVIGCDEFLMIVPRSKEYFSENSLSSLCKNFFNTGFLGLLTIKSKSEFEKVMREGRPT